MLLRNGRPALVEEVLDAAHHVRRHPVADLLGQLDEAELVAERAHAVRQVVRIDGDAVTADAGSGIERSKAERLRRRGLDGVPQVDLQLVAEHRHLVDQRDVHVAVRVLQQLGELRLATAAGADHGVHERAVERCGALGAVRGEPTDDLRRVLQAVHRVARVDALRREGEVEVHAGHETGLLQHPTHLGVGGARVGRALEDHEHAGVEMGADALRRPHHGGQVGALVLLQRRRHADDSHVGVGQRGGVGGGAEAAGEEVGDRGVGDVVHVGATGVQPVHHAWAGIEADHREAGLHGLHHERQTDVAEADDDELGGGLSRHEQRR